MARDPAQRGNRLLVLGAGPAQLGLLAAARARGLYVIGVDRDPAAPGFRFADRRALISAEDEVSIERLARSERVDGVIAPGIDWPVAIAARVADRLGLPHPISPEVGVLATSKVRQRERLAEAGVSQPRWRLVTDPELAKQQTVARPRGPAVPCVVKAPDRQGQRGLSVVERPEELAGAVTAAIEASRSGAALVEELLPGPEITVNAFSVDGAFIALTVTDRVTADPPAFGVALAHVWPSEAAGEAAAQVAGRAAGALGIRNGPTYTQLRIGPDGPQLVELAARLGGGHDAELCLAALGVDLNGLALAAALGEPLEPPQPDSRAGGACVRFLVAPPGELRVIAGVEEAQAQDGVVDVRVYRRPGHRFGELRRGADRAGAVLAVGADREEALARADRAAQLVRFDVIPSEARVGP